MRASNYYCDVYCPYPHPTGDDSAKELRTLPYTPDVRTVYGLSRELSKGLDLVWGDSVAYLR